jgi:hypothetical protein
MRVTLGELRRIVQQEGQVSAHPSYMKKEAVRNALQSAVVRAVESGIVKNASDLKHFFETAPMALDALKMVPIEAYQKLAGIAPSKKH